nr:MAG TPA: hypothetical protein [Caudoviricetes sp.]
MRKNPYAALSGVPWLGLAVSGYSTRSKRLTNGGSALIDVYRPLPVVHSVTGTQPPPSMMIMNSRSCFSCVFVNFIRPPLNLYCVLQVQEHHTRLTYRHTRI